MAFVGMWSEDGCNSSRLAIDRMGLREVLMRVVSKELADGEITRAAAVEVAPVQNSSVPLRAGSDSSPELMAR